MLLPAGKNDIDWGEHLWRYLTPQRFEDLLDQRSLYFAAATQFVDPFEGAVAVMPPDFPVDCRYEGPEPFESAFEQLKRLTKLNCWHRADGESDGMWRLYSGDSKGVALRSTPSRLDAALRPFHLEPQYGAEDIYAGPVQYVDLLKVRLSQTTTLERFFFKHTVFEWEREFRLAIALSRAEEFGAHVPDLGVRVDVDLDALVDAIYLGPALTDGERELLIRRATDAGLGDRIVKSSLLGRPRYI